MTYQDAVYTLGTIKWVQVSDSRAAKEREAIAMAIEALEKQIPKKPIAVINVDSEDTYRCPSCRATLMFRFQKATFASLCHHCICGQALDWSDE